MKESTEATAPQPNVAHTSLVNAERLAARLAALRAAAGISLERLAERSGLTKSYLSKLERGLCEPSISSTSRLAAAFGIGIAELLGHTVSDSGLRLCRSGAHRPLATAAGAARVEFLVGSPEGSRIGLSAFLSSPPLLHSGSGARPPSADHGGEEMVYVLEGRIRLQVADRVEELAVGDSAWYRAEIPHRMDSLGRKPARVLIVTGGGSGDPSAPRRRPAP